MGMCALHSLKKKSKFSLVYSLFTVYSVLTEMSETSIQLSHVQEKFILHWGEMGTKWGINRTVAQIHALLYIWPEPLNAEQITKTLSVARSNVSTSIKELQSWGLVKIIHVMGDRRDHFETLEDVWEMFRIVLDERKRREVDPTLVLLRDCLEEQKKFGKRGKRDEYTEGRLEALQEFFESAAGSYERMRSVPTSTLRRLAKMGDKVLKLLKAA